MDGRMNDGRMNARMIIIMVKQKTNYSHIKDNWKDEWKDDPGFANKIGLCLLFYLLLE